MRIVVAGDARRSPQVLLDTKDAVGLLIFTDDGQPSVIMQMTSDGKGWVRYTRQEDKNFDEVARQLGLLK
jgi:hypothetical protein